MLLLVFLCYTVGTILAGFAATEFYTLLIFRIIQGVAVALVPVAVRIARDLFPPEKFPFAQGVILSMYQGGSAVGLHLERLLFILVAGRWSSFQPYQFHSYSYSCFGRLFPKSQQVLQEGKGNDSAPKRHGKVIDIPGVITMAITTSTFMLCFTFLGKGSEGVVLFWTFLAIGVASMMFSL